MAREQVVDALLLVVERLVPRGYTFPIGSVTPKEDSVDVYLAEDDAALREVFQALAPGLQAVFIVEPKRRHVAVLPQQIHGAVGKN